MKKKITVEIVKTFYNSNAYFYFRSHDKNFELSVGPNCFRLDNEIMPFYKQPNDFHKLYSVKHET